jgi:hypothetical protein
MISVKLISVALSKLVCRYLEHCLSLNGDSFERKFIIPPGFNQIFVSGAVFEPDQNANRRFGAGYWSCLKTSVFKQQPLKNRKMRSILQDLFNNQPGY